MRSVLLKSWAGLSRHLLLLFLYLVVLERFCPAYAQLNEHCTVSILNRTVQVKPDGTWVLPNVPANFGKVRARATCTENGVTRTGQTDSFVIPSNGSVTVQSASLTNVDPIPAALRLTAPTVTLSTPGETTQLTVTATLPDGSNRNVTTESTGTSYTTSNRAVATVSSDGLVTAVAGGAVIISALNEGALGLIRLQVAVTGGDSDGDGISDEVETANGLNPNDPIDATLDPDNDGLTNKQELVDYSTNPQVADTDGDGVRDGLEIQTGSNPLDPGSLNLAQALSSIDVLPAASVLILNTILGEAAQQLTVRGNLRDGSTIDLTSTARGTNYTSSDLSVCNFSPISGQVFAGADGSCTVTATNNGFSANSALTIQSFAPRARASLAIPGYANNVDVSGTYAYVAAGSAGLQVVDVSNPNAPVIVGSRDTPGNADDVRIVGTLAYVADGPAGLQILDISTPTNPVIVGTVDTPGDAQDVMISGTRAYIADGSAGLQVIDVSTPTAPSILGAVDTPGTARGVAVVGDIAIVVDDAPSGGIRIIDTTNPTSPQIQGNVVLTSGVKDVAVRDTFAYVVAGDSGFHVVDFSAPASPRIVAFLPAGVSFSGYDIELSGQFALVADRAFLTTALPIVDITDSIMPLYRATVDFPSSSTYYGTGLAVTSQYGYLTGATSNEENGSAGDTRLFIGQYLTGPLDQAGIPPFVQITSPAPETIVTGGTTVPVVVNATDDVTVAVVDLLVNGQVAGRVLTRGSARFNVVVPSDSPTLTLGARAIDFAGNIGIAQDVTYSVSLDPPPTVQILSPTPGQTVTEGSTLSVTVDATDNSGVTSVLLLVGGQPAGTDTVAPYEFTVTVPVGGNSVTIGAVATDTGGRTTTATPVTLSVVGAQGQTRVEGQILAQDGSPVVGATVTCQGVSAVTNGAGAVSLAQVPTASPDTFCAIVLPQPGGGFVARTVPVSLTPGGVTQLGTVTLARDPGARYAGQEFFTEDFTYAVVSADVNQDLIPDVVTANSGTISVLLGAGNGTFFPEQQVAVGDGPSALAVADLNSDGRLDLTVINRDSGDLSVLQGNGNGTVQAEQRLTAGACPNAATIGDIDGDGRADLVVGDYCFELVILFGNGDGTFQEPQGFAYADSLSAVAVADMNSDGKPDIIGAYVADGMSILYHRAITP